MNIASIDIGTNTVLLLIAKLDLPNNIAHVIFEDQKIPRIGTGLKPGFPISADKELNLIEILKSYKSLAISNRCEKILVTATNAFRIASNSVQLIQKIKSILDLTVNVISEEEEAKLTFLGCTWERDNNKDLLVIDIGGGSTEVGYGKNSNLLALKSMHLGVVNLTEDYFSSSPPGKNEITSCKAAIRKELLNLFKINTDIDEFIAVSGTPTTLACIKKEMKNYNETQIEGDILNKDDLINFVDHLSALSSLEIKRQFGSVVEGREDILLAGAIILFETMMHLNTEKITVSARGVRYGAVYNFIQKLP